MLTPAFLFPCRCRFCKDGLFSDRFTEVKPGYTTHGLIRQSDGAQGSPVFTVTDQHRLRLSPTVPATLNDDGTYFQTLARPGVDGLRLSISAKTWILGTTAGIFIGGSPGVLFIARYQTTDFFRQTCANNGQAVPGVAAAFNSTVAPFTDGDEIGLQIVDTSAGAGTFRVEFLHEGIVVRTDTSQSLVIPDPVNIGVFTTDGGEWDDFCIRD